MEESKSEELKDEMGIIVDQCERAKDIIDRLLKFAKPGRAVFKKTSINDCIETVAGFVEHQYSLSNVKIVKDYEKGLPEVKIDEKQIQEVLLNLFGNSFDAMPYGGAITVKTLQEAGNIRIDVKDTGSGISETNLKRVLEPFFTTKEKGTGLGLPVCYGVIKAHGGELEFESKPGQGTTVTIFLPIEE
jgi:signal transduction histidine kinase